MQRPIYFANFQLDSEPYIRNSLVFCIAAQNSNFPSIFTLRDQQICEVEFGVESLDYRPHPPPD
jgi:hypothetical protein